MKFLSIGSFLAISGLAAAGHLHQATSYSVVTKHEPAAHHGWSGEGANHGWAGQVDSHGWTGQGAVSHGWAGQGAVSHGWAGQGDSHGWSNGGDSYGHGWEQQDHHAHPKYAFNYGVKDLKTGDIKEQWEHRDGDHVKGSYSLKEADGTTRVVEYHADDHNGFNAVVKKIGHAHHPEVVHHGGGGWEGVYAGDHGYGYSNGHGHGHASSYADVHLH